MRWLVPKSLAGQMVALLMLALVAGHVAAIAIFADERREAVRQATREQVVSRTAAVVRTLAATPDPLRPLIARSLSSDILTVTLHEADPGLPVPTSRHERRLARRLTDALGVEDADIRIAFRDPWRPFWRRGPWRDGRGMGRHGRWFDDDDFEDDDDDDRYPGPYRNLGLRIAVKTPDAPWIETVPGVAFPRPPWAAQSLIAVALTAVAILIAVIFIVRRVTRPLGALARTADAVGRGETVEDVAEAGPRDVRDTIRAFNLMRARQQKFIEDRTNLLAAVSHDLRTPITALRIRAEFIEDADLRGKIIEMLDEMQTITEATLLFAREEAQKEENRPTDIAALIESLAGDLEDMGHDVALTIPDRLVLDCRPIALKRALRNLIENAVNYGERARIEMSAFEDGVRITIDDDGPGIPEDQLDRIFEPFVRIETSRSRDTGGIGMGLAITRTIVHGHGGDIDAVNRDEGGLRIVVTLPSRDGGGSHPVS